MRLNNSWTVVQAVDRVEGFLRLNEGYVLQYLARAADGEQSIVEIGSWKGRSTVCLANGSHGIQKIYAIDPHLGYLIKNNKQTSTYHDFLNTVVESGIRENVTPVRKTSAEAAKAWDKSIGLVFIDGLHDLVHAKEDISIWQPLVAEGGYIACHDAFLGEVGVCRALIECLRPDAIHDIGCVGSIVFWRVGKPTNLAKLKFHWIRWLLRKHISGQRFPVWVHPFLRLPLLNRIMITSYWSTITEKK